MDVLSYIHTRIPQFRTHLKQPSEVLHRHLLQLHVVCSLVALESYAGGGRRSHACWTLRRREGLLIVSEEEGLAGRLLGGRRA